jgi:hypothetical protein
MSNVITIRIRKNKANNTFTARAANGLTQSFQKSLDCNEKKAFWEVLKEFSKVVGINGSFVMGDIEENTKAFTLMDPESVQVISHD